MFSAHISLRRERAIFAYGLMASLVPRAPTRQALVRAVMAVTTKGGQKRLALWQMLRDVEALGLEWPRPAELSRKTCGAGLG